MSEESEELEGFPMVDGASPIDDDFAAPGRSVFGDSDLSFDEDDDVIPHWSEPATGTVPHVGSDSSGMTFDPAPDPITSRPKVDPITTTPSIESSPTVPAGGDDRLAWAEAAATPQWADDAAAQADPGLVQIVDESAAAEDFFGFDDPSAVVPAGVAPASGSARQEREDRQSAPLGETLGAVVGSAETADRNLATAAGVALGLAAAFAAALFLGPLVTLLLVTIALGVGAVEYFNAIRVAGYQPAVLLGLVAVVAMPLATYWRGPAAMGLVLVLALMVGALWYVLGIGQGGMVNGLGSTMLGMVHIGLLGSFAALMLAVDTYGTGILIVAVALTAAYDIGGYFIGKAVGRTPLSPASPNKTIEGLLGGAAAVMVVAFVLALLGIPAPLASSADGGGVLTILIVGLAAAYAAPVGDLAESQIKRDLDIKDMGTILPGHGGLLDRFDGLLFVLPAVWFVTNALVLS